MKSIFLRIIFGMDKRTVSLSPVIPISLKIVQSLFWISYNSPPFYTYIYFGRVPKFGMRHNASCIYSSRFFFFLKLYITIDRIIAPVPISAIAKGVMSEKSPVFRADKSPPPLFGGKIGLRLPTLKVMV